MNFTTIVARKSDKQGAPRTPTHNFYRGMIDNKIPFKTPIEQTHDKWQDNSYYQNYIVMIPLTIAKYLMVNEALEDIIIRDTSAFVERLRTDSFLEGIQIEFNQRNGGTQLTMRYMLAIPETDNRWTMRQTFNYTLPTIDETARQDIATFLIDIFSSRQFLQTDTYEWYRGTGVNVHTHSQADSNTLHESLVTLLKEDCQITLQRFPMMLKAINPNGNFARTNGAVEAWSLNKVDKVTNG